jgi:hypothetical protein
VALISLGIDALDPKLDCSTKTTTLHYALVNVAVNASLSIARFVDVVFVSRTACSSRSSTRSSRVGVLPTTSESWQIRICLRESGMTFLRIVFPLYPFV